MASLRSGKVKANDGGFISLAGAERALGNPSVNGYILSSQTDGTRSWVNPTGLSVASSITVLDDGGSLGSFFELKFSSANLGLSTVGSGRTVEIELTDDPSFSTIGIGTTNSVGIVTTAKLDVEGDVRFSNRIYDENGSAGTLDYVLSSNGPNTPWSWKIVTDTGAGVLDAILVREEGADVGAGGTNTTLDFYGNFSLSQTSAGIASVKLKDTLDIVGLNVSGVSTFNDNVHLGDADILYLGDDNDLQLRHNGTTSEIKQNNSGTFFLKNTGTTKITNSTGLQDRAIFNQTSVELFYDDSKKFETTTDGFKVVNGTSETAVISGPQNIIVDPSPDDVVAIATGNISGANVSTITGITTTDIAVGNLIQEVDGIISTGTTVTSVGVDQVGISKTSLGSASAEEFTFVNQTPTGVVRIKGDLYVDGTRTEINSTTLTIDDLNVVVASGATNALTADTAGLTVDGADAYLKYNYNAGSNETWELNKNVGIGTDNAAAKLDINGDLNISGVATAINKVSIKSDDSTPGRIDLYCEVSNAHYARIQAPAHSEFSGNVTITLPNSDGTLLLTDGDGSSLTNVNAETVTGAENSDSTDYRVPFLSASTGIASVYTNSGLQYNPATNLLTGQISHVKLTANNSTDETVYLTFVDGSTGSQELETDTGLYYNPSTNTLNAGAFSGDGSALSGVGGGGDGADFNTGLSTTKYHSAANDIDGFTAIGVSFPSTSGKTYLVPSIHITNVSTGDLYITSRIDYSGGENVPLTNKILIPYQGSLEIIDESLVANPSDHLRFAAYAGIATNAAGVANGLDCFVSYEEKSDTNYIGTGSTIVDTIGGVGYAQTVFTSTTNPSIINTIVLTNYSDVVDADVSVSIFRNGTIQQGYLAYNLTVPQNSSVQILPRSKRLNASDTIVVNASAANIVGVNIAGKYIV